MSSGLKHPSYIIKNGQQIDSLALKECTQGRDGIFETIHVLDGKIEFWDLHIDRLLKGMAILRLKHSEKLGETLLAESMELILASGIKEGRLRVSLQRKNPPGQHPDYSSYDYTIALSPYSPPVLPARLVLFKEGKKGIDNFSGIKQDFNPLYQVSLIYALEHQATEAVLLNNEGRICETSISNLFIVKNGMVCTPPLTEGCVAGIMRHCFLKFCIEQEIKIIEQPLQVEYMEDADEIFLTNSLKYIQPVEAFESRPFSMNYTNHLKLLFSSWIKSR